MASHGHFGRPQSEFTSHGYSRLEHKFHDHELFFFHWDDLFSGISHCRDLGSIDHKEDSKPLIESKLKIRNLVKNWLESGNISENKNV